MTWMMRRWLVVAAAGRGPEFAAGRPYLTARGARRAADAMLRRAWGGRRAVHYRVVRRAQ